MFTENFEFDTTLFSKTGGGGGTEQLPFTTNIEPVFPTTGGGGGGMVS